MAACILMLRMLFRGRGDLMVERFYALCQGFSYVHGKGLYVCKNGMKRRIL